MFWQHRSQLWIPTISVQVLPPYQAQLRCSQSTVTDAYNQQTAQALCSPALYPKPHKP